VKTFVEVFLHTSVKKIQVVLKKKSWYYSLALCICKIKGF